MFSNIPCCSINNFIRCNKECWMYCLFSSGYGWLCTAWVEVHKNISERDNALWVIYKHAHGVNTACLQYCLLGGCLRAVFQHAYQTVTLTFIWSHTFQILSGEALIYNDTWIGAAKPHPIFLGGPSPPPETTCQELNLALACERIVGMVWTLCCRVPSKQAFVYCFVCTME